MKRTVASISIGLFAGAFACVAHAADIKIGGIYDYTGPFAGGGSISGHTLLRATGLVSSIITPHFRNVPA